MTRGTYRSLRDTGRLHTAAGCQRSYPTPDPRPPCATSASRFAWPAPPRGRVCFALRTLSNAEPRSRALEELATPPSELLTVGCHFFFLNFARSMPAPPRAVAAARPLRMTEVSLAGEPSRGAAPAEIPPLPAAAKASAEYHLPRYAIARRSISPRDEWASAETLETHPCHSSSRPPRA